MIILSFDLQPTWKDVSNDTSTPQGEQLCQSILKFMHKCRINCPDKSTHAQHTHIHWTEFVTTMSLTLQAGPIKIVYCLYMYSLNCHTLSVYWACTSNISPPYTDTSISVRGMPNSNLESLHYEQMKRWEKQNQSSLSLSCRQRNPNPRVNGKCQKRGLPSLQHYPFNPRVEISRSSLETNVWLFFLPMTLKAIKYHSPTLLFMTFYIA